MHMCAVAQLCSFIQTQGRRPSILGWGSSHPSSMNIIMRTLRANLIWIVSHRGLFPDDSKWCDVDSSLDLHLTLSGFSTLLHFKNTYHLCVCVCGACPQASCRELQVVVSCLLSIVHVGSSDLESPARAASTPNL